jgi:lipoprotein-anchoring transpeptidase ErfK/SrfK
VRLRTALTSAVAVLAVAGGGVAAYETLGTGSQPGSVTAAQGTAELSPLPPPPAKLVVALQNAQGQVPWDQPLRLVAEHAAITSTSVTGPGGQALPGHATADGSEWRSSNTLEPLETYTVHVAYQDLRGKSHTDDLKVLVADSEKHLRPVLNPAMSAVVGIGQPAIVTFNRTVPDSEKADVERRLTISTSPSVEGSWHWISGTEIHWRPQNYWVPGTTVTFGVNLAHLYLGDGVWGERDAHTATYRIGDSHVSKVDVKNHSMQVFANGKLVKTFKISAGREDKWPTMGGVHIALDKAPTVIMDSATVGIPRNSPDGYYETVKWDVRISNGGAFVHSAPWSVADQGNTNVSHGCVNLAPSDAEWFYNFSQRGDIIDIFNTPRQPVRWDAGTADWNMSWADWLAGSALH